MENFIDKTIEWLENFKKNKAVVENVSVTYGYSTLPDEHGNLIKIPNGEFEMIITGRNLKTPSNK